MRSSLGERGGGGGASGSISRGRSGSGSRASKVVDVEGGKDVEEGEDDDEEEAEAEEGEGEEGGGEGSLLGDSTGEASLERLSAIKVRGEGEGEDGVGVRAGEAPLNMASLDFRPPDEGTLEGLPLTLVVSGDEGEEPMAGGASAAEPSAALGFLRIGLGVTLFPR